MFMMRILQTNNKAKCEKHTTDGDQKKSKKWRESLRPATGWQDELLEQSSRPVCYSKLTVAVS